MEEREDCRLELLDACLWYREEALELISDCIFESSSIQSANPVTNVDGPFCEREIAKCCVGLKSTLLLLSQPS